MSATKLNVNGVIKKSTEINLDDLKWLYLDFYKRNGKYPAVSDGLAKNNLPQSRIIKRIIEENNLTHSDFLLSIGKVSNARSKPKDYDYYVNKFKEVCKKENRVLLANDLTNNKYGLPNVGYFIKYCPDNNVKNFKDFIKWCGFNRLQCYEVDKEFADKSLIAYQNKIGYDKIITKKDITFENVGFSMTVISRIYGSLTKAKEELKLNTERYVCKPKPFEYYKNKLDYVLSKIDKNIISWQLLETLETEDGKCIEHKSMLKSFKDNNVDFYAYIKSKGFLMNESHFGNVFIFDDGEKAMSNYEYMFSKYLKENGYTYKKDYKRDVMYKTIDSSLKRKINCDYLIKDTYIEIAGFLRPTTDDWRTENYASKKENTYRDNMIEKENILIKHNKKYIILFQNDFDDGRYIDIINAL